MLFSCAQLFHFSLWKCIFLKDWTSPLGALWGGRSYTVGRLSGMEENALSSKLMNSMFKKKYEISELRILRNLSIELNSQSLPSSAYIVLEQYSKWASVCVFYSKDFRGRLQLKRWRNAVSSKQRDHSRELCNGVWILERARARKFERFLGIIFAWIFFFSTHPEHPIHKPLGPEPNVRKRHSPQDDRSS